jgi:hypothetical protein
MVLSSLKMVMASPVCTISGCPNFEQALFRSSKQSLKKYQCRVEEYGRAQYSGSTINSGSVGSLVCEASYSGL